MTNGFVLATDPMLPPHGLTGAVYAIGNFDGLHLGHRVVIERAVAMARERAAPSAMLTFEPHPADFFARRPVVFRLTPPRDKAAVAARLGLSGLVLLPFDAALAGMSAEEFITKILIARLGVGAVVVGWDFHFGKGRSGSPATLAGGGPKIRLRRRDCRESRRQRWRRLLHRHSQGARAGRPRRRGAGPRTQLCGFRPSHFRPASGAQAWRADGEYRARADQPARPRDLRGRGAGGRARLSGGGQLRHPPDGR